MSAFSTAVEFVLSFSGKVAGGSGTAAGKGIGATIDTIGPSVGALNSAREDAENNPNSGGLGSGAAIASGVVAGAAVDFLVTSTLLALVAGTGGLGLVGLLGAYAI